MELSCFQDENCAISLDLTQFERDEYCPWCHNLSRNDHGPALREMEANHGYDWYKKEGSLMYYHVSFKLMKDMYGGLDDLRCRYCIMLKSLFQLQDAVAGVAERYLEHEVLVIMSPDGKVNVVRDAQSGAYDYCELYHFKNPSAMYVVGEPPAAPPLFCGDGSLQFVERCLSECRNVHHETCSSALDEGDFRPTRLLFIADDQGRVQLRMTETRQILGVVSYIALSHCWGESQPIKLTKNNYTELQNGFAYTRLSTVFQNAVDFAIRLGVDSLWIDSLCIIQGDREDWAHEAAQMGLIYENSFLTIAATRSKNGSEPFLDRQARYDSPYVKALVRDHESGGTALIAIRTANHGQGVDKVQGPLAQRAWTYQESLLPPRLVHFTSRGIVWDCKGACRVEEERTPREVLRSRRDDRTSWREHVSNYSSRAITFPSDRLPALSGCVAHYRKRQGPKSSIYLAGLWLHELEIDLSWEAIFTSGFATKKDLALSAITQFGSGMPSWSWASIPKKVRWDASVNDNSLRRQVSVVGYKCEAATSDMYGEVKAGSSIELEARLTSVTVQPVMMRPTSQPFFIPEQSKAYKVGLYGNGAKDSSSTAFFQDCLLQPKLNSLMGQQQYSRVQSLEEAEASWEAVPTLNGYCILLYITAETAVGLVLADSQWATGGYERLGLVIWQVEGDARWPPWRDAFAASELQTVTLY